MQAFQELLEKKRALEAEKHDLDKRLAEADAKWKEAHVAEVKALMDKHGIKLSDLKPNSIGAQIMAKANRRSKPAIKYRGANGETWTGRGLCPKWLRGLNKEDFKV